MLRKLTRHYIECIKVDNKSNKRINFYKEDRKLIIISITIVILLVLEWALMLITTA